MVRPRGLGALSKIEDDGVLLEILAFCSHIELTRLNMTSRALYVYSMHNELWRYILYN